MKKISFIGVGIMGKSMVRNLMKAGYQLSIYTRTKKKVEDLIDGGCTYLDTVAECAANGEIICTMVGYPSDVEEVYFGAGGIIENAPKGSFLIDFTTSSPELAERIYKEAKAKGISSIDAPVTGGDVGAREGTLTILAGGDKSAYDSCQDIFKAVGNNPNYMGPAGCGQHTKLCNQIAIAGALSGACEAYAYACSHGLDPKMAIASISKGAAASTQMSVVLPRAMDGNMDPGFFIKHFIKDMRLADDEAKAVGKELPVLSKVLSMFEELSDKGYDDLGTQALVKYYE